MKQFFSLMRILQNVPAGLMVALVSGSVLAASPLGGEDGGSSVGGIGRVSGVLGSKTLICSLRSASAPTLEFHIQRGQNGELSPIVRDRGLMNHPLTAVRSVGIFADSQESPKHLQRVVIQLGDERDAANEEKLKFSVKDFEEMSSNADLQRDALLVRKAQEGSPLLLTCRIR